MSTVVDFHRPCCLSLESFNLVHEICCVWYLRSTTIVKDGSLSHLLFKRRKPGAE